MADLKPCPFCGGGAETCLGPIRGKWGARCKNCDVWRDDRENSEVEAIAAWNRRATDPRDEVIRGLREALINAAANLETVSRADQLGDVQKQQCRAWSDEAFAAARKLMGGNNG